MIEQERELNFMICELEHENRLLRARNDRLTIEMQLLAETIGATAKCITTLEVSND